MIIYIDNLINLITNQHKCEEEVKYYYNSTRALHLMVLFSTWMVLRDKIFKYYLVLL